MRRIVCYGHNKATFAIEFDQTNALVQFAGVRVGHVFAGTPIPEEQLTVGGDAEEIERRMKGERCHVLAGGGRIGPFLGRVVG